MSSTEEIYPSAERLNLLLVEDSRADASLFKRVLLETAAQLQLHVVGDGVEALRFLRREEPYANAPTPHLIILDLNLPRKNGLEVLAEIKTDPALKIVPVIVLTSSDSEEDIRASYALGANTYLRKAASLDQTLALLHAMQHFWTRLVVLPNVTHRSMAAHSVRA